MTIQYSTYFEKKTRSNGESFYCLKDGTPDELDELIRDIHFEHFFGCLPNDWVYEQIYFVLSEFEEGCTDEDELSKRLADSYTALLVKWLENSYAGEYCQYVMEHIPPKLFWDIITEAQEQAITNICYSVEQFLEDNESMEENND